ncbi:hypothetical protein EC162442_04476 [Escherichia coli O145:H28]|nr:hypothetical protein EC162442_04476 [Escherichia coli O145:H28]
MFRDKHNIAFRINNRNSLIRQDDKIGDDFIIHKNFSHYRSCWSYDAFYIDIYFLIEHDISFQAGEINGWPLLFR